MSKQVLAFSKGTISIGPQAEKPALLTRTSGPVPSVRSKARSAQAATELWSVTSRASGVIAPREAATMSVSVAGSRAVASTRWPRSAA